MTFDGLPAVRAKKWTRLSREHRSAADAANLARWLKMDGIKVKVTKETRWVVHCLQACLQTK